MSASVTVRPGDSYSSPTWMSSKNRRVSMLVGGPDMAPHTPQRSSRPGEPVALLWIAHTGNLLFDGPNSKSRDKPIEEEIVDDGDGDAGDQAGGHQRAPVIHVAAHQRHRHADAHGHALDGGDEGQAVDE